MPHRLPPSPPPVHLLDFPHHYHDMPPAHRAIHYRHLLTPCDGPPLRIHSTAADGYHHIFHPDFPIAVFAAWGPF